ncbi:hypothetical protein CKO44_01125 [Rubrivivax gelatinosus]|nr:hypothetical protein [Rubrivivax gelatinosus]MBK1612073.1 hypothetical protein [Rubrivivax gelatinosus]
MTPAADEAALAGFWGGGFEGADHVNARGDRLDLAAWQGHVDCLEGDHLRARAAGLTWVRESIGWRLAETAPGRWDLTRAGRIARSADSAGLQVAWTLWHYGIPPDLCLHDDRLIPRFAAFAAEVARTVGRASLQPPLFTPVNEIGFLAWAASQRGLLHAPDDGPDTADEGSRISGYAVKRRLVRAALAAMAAMREAEPRCRFLHVEPIVHVVAPSGQPELAPLAEQIRSWQWQTCDLLSGRAEPELGGHEGALDLIGLNHYHASQWEALTEQRLAWHLHDARRMPLSRLLAEAWQRYRRPLVLAETGHVGAGRAAWLDEVA